ncbi:MAG: ZIP family metal transporter [Clostridiales bacterium]|nr:ZIP family metal transporter [Clostridiales bacterium]
MQIFSGIMIPCLGTILGAAFICFLKKEIGRMVEQSLTGFASGVMVAASIWSLLIPAMELEGHLGVFSFVPAVIGFVGGILFLIAGDRLILWFHKREQGSRKKNRLLVLAVTVHNIPEGLSVGAAFAGLLNGESGITKAAAFALAVGIGIQNIPEGFIVALPFRNQGCSRVRSFFLGSLSGLAEPAAAFCMILLGAWLRPLLPYLLAFSAGAMFYVVIEELLPDAMENRKYHIGTVGFSAGFLLMMILDVALG